MESICYHCGQVFPSLSARDIHILHFSGFPPYLPRDSFTRSFIPSTPEAPRLVMLPSPPATPITESFPNPFRDVHALSPRMFPQPVMYIPIMPTVYEWSNHLLTKGCSKLGKGCLDNCIPGNEELQRRSRFPLLPTVTSGRVKKNTSSQGAKKKQQCWICKWKFLRLKIHISEVHLKEKKYTCGVCGKRFAKRVNLRAHWERHE